MDIALADGTTHPVYRSSCGPWIVSYYGIPTVAYDLLFRTRPLGTHYIPWNRVYPDVITPDGCIPVSVEQLHAERSHEPGAPLRFTLSEASAIFSRYWTRRERIRDLAREYAVSRLTINSIIQRKSYWWI